MTRNKLDHRAGSASLEVAPPTCKRFLLRDWTFDAGRGCLQRGDETRKLNLKEASVLRHLAATAPGMVRRDQLLDHTWPDVVVGDHVLDEVIGRLRRYLGDKARDPQYIETLPKRGYRIVVPVETLPWPVSDVTGRRRRRVWLWGAVTIAALALAGTWQWTRAPVAADSRSVMVLPLSVTTADDPWLQKYASALTQELRARLAAYVELQTIDAADTPARETTAEVPTAYLVRGHVQRFATRPHLRVSLVRSTDRQVVWAARYDPPGDASADPQDTASTVARFVRLELVRDEQCKSVKRRSTSAEAARLVCAAQAMNYRINQKGEFDPWVLRANAERAIQLDDTLLEAYQLLPTAYYFLAAFGEISRAEASRLAHRAIDRALAIEPTSAYTLWSLGFVEALLDLNYDSSERHLRRAIAIDPLHPNARWFHGQLAILAKIRGELHSALDHYRRAIRLYDSDGRIQAEYAECLYFAGEYQDAIQAADLALKLSPYALAAWSAVRSKFHAQLALGDQAAAESTLNAYLESAEPEWKPYAAAMLPLVGREGEARHSLAAIESQPRPVRYALILSYLTLRDVDRAYRQLEQAVDVRDPIVLTRVRLDPAFKILQGDGRWSELMRALEPPGRSDTTAAGPLTHSTRTGARS